MKILSFNGNKTTDKLNTKMLKSNEEKQNQFQSDSKHMRQKNKISMKNC